MITPLSAICGALKGVEILILNAQTVDETVSTIICPGPGINNHTFTFTSSASITGAVQVEASNDPAYTGVWAPLNAVIDVATIGPAAAGKLQVKLSNLMLSAVRVRISTVIGGGNLSASYVGN